MQRLTILLYHRVLPERDPLRTGLVYRSWFEQQLGIVGRMFDVMPLAEAVRRLRDGTLARATACITFDDGYGDNESVALDVLRRYGMPATFFIASDYLDGGCMWNDRVVEAVRGAVNGQLDLTDLGLGRHRFESHDERRRTAFGLIDKIKYHEPERRNEIAAAVVERAGIRMPNLMMSSSQVKALHSAGMEIGGHTATHPILASLEPRDAVSDILRGKRRLEEITGAAVKSFAYPNGKPQRDYRAEHVQIVREAGFEVAVSTAEGVATRACDVHQLPRFVPWPLSKWRLAFELARNSLRTRPALA